MITVTEVRVYYVNGVVLRKMRISCKVEFFDTWAMERYRDRQQAIYEQAKTIDGKRYREVDILLQKEYC